ncbi:MAG: NADH-quinone oxidoreductase subunit NuoK [Chloroflexi bacterium]|nr:NADH-quinone oxidoreductase subunit NuoK [Chloroflexota bacterium]|tara:strand:+ start:1244 stop:1609 length:366 start_codon:yes stop_codon:yes gene_type:complete
MTLLHFEIVSAALFCLGLYGVLSRRSGVIILMSIEVMLNAINLNLVAFASFRPYGQANLMKTASTATDTPVTSMQAPDGLIITIFIITIAAAEIALAMAIILRLFRKRGSVHVDEISEMRG